MFYCGRTESGQVPGVVQEYESVEDAVTRLQTLVRMGWDAALREPPLDEEGNEVEVGRAFDSALRASSMQPPMSFTVLGVMYFLLDQPPRPVDFGVDGWQGDYPWEVVPG